MPRRRSTALPGQEYVVKCCLKRALRHKGLLSDIAKWVKHASRIAHRGALIVNIHLLRVLTETNDDGSPIPLPDLNDLTFYNQCFLIGINARAFDIDPAIIETWQKYGLQIERIPDPENGREDEGANHRLVGDPQVIIYLAIKYQTNLLNHLKGTFLQTANQDDYGVLQ